MAESNGFYDFHQEIISRVKDGERQERVSTLKINSAPPLPYAVIFVI
jgi:hypothetical protein